ncbi:MAG: hypothetical protein WAK17_00510 [Candidatus Nitrosopolaris sp.]
MVRNGSKDGLAASVAFRSIYGYAMIIREQTCGSNSSPKTLSLTPHTFPIATNGSHYPWTLYMFI